MGIKSDILSKRLNDIRDLVFNNRIWIEAEETFYQSNIIRGIRKIIINNNYAGNYEKELEAYEKIIIICSANMNKKRSELSCFFSGKKVERPQALMLLVKNILESDEIESNEIMVLASYRFFINKKNKTICIKKVGCREELHVSNIFEEIKSYKLFDFFNTEMVFDINIFEGFRMALDSKAFENCIKKIGQDRAPKRPLCI